MNEVKLQIGCLVIMIYIIIMCVRGAFRGNIKSDKYFVALLCIAP